jgi:UDP-glucose 4-epimerase
MQGLIGVAISCIVRGQPVRLFGDPENVRDYIHLDDLCEIAFRAATPSEPFRVVNVGTGIGHSVTDVLRIIQEYCGSPLRVERESNRGQWLPDWVVLNTQEARKHFAWEPRIDLRSGVASMIDTWERGVETLAANV